MTNDKDETTGDPFESTEFNQGVSVGIDLGRYAAEQEAKRAFEMGEIELWLEYNTPRTLEDWETYLADKGENFSDRWKTEETDDSE